ncbi:MAG: hypothetical protein IIB87_05075 [Chloroflexi bacterium]|nr:hypothetical protein [Chloroflexota bacterium]
MNRHGLPLLALLLLALIALAPVLVPGDRPAGASTVEANAFIGGAALGSQALRGDVDGNGEVNSIDAFLILQHEAGIIWPPPYSEEYYQSADVNEDGFVSVVDVSLILQFHAGLIESL